MSRRVGLREDADVVVDEDDDGVGGLVVKLKKLRVEKRKAGVKKKGLVKPTPEGATNNMIQSDN